MIMKTASRKAKGRLGQQEVCEKIYLKDLGLKIGDIESRPMSSPGDDLMLSPVGLEKLYFDGWEIKRRARISIIRWMEQVFKRKRKKPIVCFREDRGEWYCMMRLEDVLELIKKSHDES